MGMLWFFVWRWWFVHIALPKGVIYKYSDANYNTTGTELSD